MLIRIIAIVLVLSVIVVIHEWGHMMAAKLLGIDVPEFAVGLGPRIAGWRGKRTEYSLRLLPLGGYCRFDEDMEKMDEKGRLTSILARGPWQKIFVSFAGPLMNFLLAILLFAALFSFIGIPGDYEPVIGEVSPGSPAEAAGLLPGDRILSLEGEPLEVWSELSLILQEKSGEEPLTLVVERAGQELALSLTPRFDETEGRLLIGVIVDAGHVIQTRFSLWEGIKLGFTQTLTLIGLLIQVISQMITGQASVTENLSGPVVLVQTISETAASGFSNTVFLTAFLSVNLGIMNLLPIPGLDGGKILLYLIEAVRRKPLDLEKEGWLNLAGFALIFFLMIALTFKDIVNVFG